MDNRLTTFLAIWGAVLGTSSLAWNIWTGSRNKPRIAAQIECKDLCDDYFINFELRNHGTRSTTIEEIMLVKYCDGILGRLRYPEQLENVSVKYKDSARLPVVLAPGEVWKGHAPINSERSAMEMDKLKLIEQGKLYYVIRCAHTSRLLTGKVKSENAWRRL